MLRYAATIFLSAFLLFLVQPLIGKYILPWFGGGSGVWTACLLFFQCVLLAGYLYAHVIVKWLSPSRQMIAHLALLSAAILFLPIVPREAFKPVDSAQPVWRIVLLLSMTLGVPYLALSATGPLLQAWFARTHVTRSPYRLYALSNLGSLLALLGYPFVVEPLLTRTTQAHAWSWAFGVFVLLCTWCTVAQRMPRAASGASVLSPSAARRARQASAAASMKASEAVDTPPTAFARVMWVLLPLCASIMLLAATTQMSEEVAPMPFIWVCPLATYLITFIIAFEWPRLYDRRVFVPLAVAAPWIYLGMLINTHGGILSSVGLYLVVLFTCCMVCHGELYRLRPDASKLTGYYLAISLGGALGGIFVGVIAPLIFTFNIEIHIALFGSIALLGTCLWHDPQSMFHRGARRPAWLLLVMALAGAGLLIRMAMSAEQANAVAKMRSFYGSLIVRKMPAMFRASEDLRLFHGRICHGSQSMNPAERYLPLMYYSPSSGIGMVMKTYPHGEGGRRIAVVGLGTGAMAAWGEPGDFMRFYEINPQIDELAQSLFTYLPDSRAKTEVVLGDARLSMEREPPQNYDIVVLDAFSGDAVPTHLLTREAFAVYKKHLKPNGVIAVNVTNRYLELHPVVHRLALDAGLNAALVMTPATPNEMVADAHWMILTTNPTILENKDIAEANVLPPTTPHVSLWTDDFCSVLEVLRE